jgi:molybdate transport system substrate-binding protein
MSLSLTVSYAGTDGSLRIFAAAGTAPAMKDIARAYTRETGIPVTFNFANAGTLARQISAGAAFDVFFSANKKWMDYVEQKGLIAPASRTVLLKDELVIIVPEGHSKTVDLSEPFQGRFAIGDQATPVGIYAKQAFTKMGCWESLQSHLCVGDTVNKVLNYVALDEADAGVVFHSIAFCASNRVDVAYAIPPELHEPILFPVAASAAGPPESAGFISFLQSPRAQAIFKQYGWTLCIPEK